MAERIEAHCPSCGARYRLRAEAAGRRARCKTCQAVFEVPRNGRSLEEDILLWLTDPRDEDEIPVRPRIVRRLAKATDQVPGGGAPSSGQTGPAIGAGHSSGSIRTGHLAGATAPREQGADGASN